MKTILSRSWAFGAMVLLAAPVGAQVRGPQAAGSSALKEAITRASQPGDLAELILAVKERALGEPFDAGIRATLKSRMEALAPEQLSALAKQGEFADIPAALGAVTSDLVYTAVTPCRVFDSRPSAGGPGPIPANTQRNVVVAGTLGFPAQGGAAGGCGVPVGATSAIINFVTVLPAGPGNIRAWAVASPQPPAPLAAVMNYGTVTGLPAIANGVAVPLCNPAATDCSLGDLRLQADTSATNIVGDVVGYFAPATGFVTSVNAITGPVTIAAGSNISVTPSGSTVTIANTAPVSTGTVTSVGTGLGLTGGPITGSGTLDIATGGVMAANIATGQVVKSLNGALDAVTIVGTGGATVSTVGSTISVEAAPAAVIMGIAGDTTLIGAGYTQFGDAIQDGWTGTATTAGVPSPRYSHTAVWTGAKMIVWGGSDGVARVNTGGQYDPVTNTWTATSVVGSVPSGRQTHRAIWTGSKMIVWGGYDGVARVNTGGQYDPVADSWTATSIAGSVPSGRQSHTAVWTGSKMIVWGGYDGVTILNTGGQYDPVSNSWMATSIAGSVPGARSSHTAVWTGSRMIVWGGTAGLGGSLNTGGQYNPVDDSWTATSTTGSVPSARYGHTAVWTGSSMIVWGGASLPTGGKYDPVADSWTATSTAGSVPSARTEHSAVWAGSRMIVWGGYSGAAYVNTGGKYDPASDSWTATATSSGVPGGRSTHTAVWTGTKMIVWGGSAFPTPFNSGGQWFEVASYVKN